MKNKLIIILLTLFISTNVSGTENDICSEKKLFNKIWCKTFGKGKDSSKSLTDIGIDSSNIKEKKTLSDWIKKKK